MARGLGLNKPCVKCGREIPASFKSPIPGFCGRCTDEVLRTLGKRAGPSDAMSTPAGSSRGSAMRGGLIGAGVVLVVGAALALLAPGAFDGVIASLRGLVGQG